MKHYFAKMKPTAVCPPRKPLKQVVWSWLGSFLGISLIVWVGEWSNFNGTSSLFLIGSFGASAVLLYGTPQAELAQPRNLLGGHFFSAVVGVTVSILFGNDSLFAGSLAVSLSIFVMHLTRTLHPPGGATALIAVIGGENVQNLGYLYVFTPVLLGALLMLFVALVINNISMDDKRHYPTYWI